MFCLSWPLLVSLLSLASSSGMGQASALQKSGLSQCLVLPVSAITTFPPSAPQAEVVTNQAELAALERNKCR